MQCLPDALAERRYYRPGEQGQEKQVKEKIEKILAWRDSCDSGSGC